MPDVWGRALIRTSRLSAIFKDICVPFRIHNFQALRSCVRSFSKVCIRTIPDRKWLQGSAMFGSAMVSEGLSCESLISTSMPNSHGQVMKAALHESMEGVT